MKRFLNITIIAILIIEIFTGVVNASGTKSVKVGDTVSVTISLGKSVTSAGFSSVSWDSSKLQYISNSLGKSLSNGGKLGFFGDTERSSVTITFEAIEKGTATVKANISEIGSDSVNKTDTTTITITEPVKEETKKPTTGTTSSSNKKTNSSSSVNKNQNTQPEENEENKEEETVPEVKPKAPNELINIENENVKNLKDETTKVMIKALENAVEDDMKLQVKIIKEGNSNLEKIENILKNIKGNKICYDIETLKENVKVQPNGYVTVCIPIPSDFAKDRLEMYYIDIEKENYELMDGKIQGDYYTFTTDHFSTYVLLEKPEPVTFAKISRDTFNAIGKTFSNLAVLYSIILILIIIIIIQTIVNMKRHEAKRSK